MRLGVGGFMPGFANWSRRGVTRGFLLRGGVIAAAIVVGLLTAASARAEDPEGDRISKAHWTCTVLYTDQFPTPSELFRDRENVYEEIKVEACYNVHNYRVGVYKRYVEDAWPEDKEVTPWKLLPVRYWGHRFMSRTSADPTWGDDTYEEK